MSEVLSLLVLLASIFGTANCRASSSSQLINVESVKVNVSNILSETLSQDERAAILESYQTGPYGSHKVSILNLTAVTLRNLNMQYESFIRELSPAAVRYPHIPIQTAEYFLEMIPSAHVWATIKDLPSDNEPWNTLPGKFVILRHIIRGSYRSVALWDSDLMTYYSMYLDGLSEHELQLFEYELPLRRLNEMANDLSVLHTKYGNKASCLSLVRNLNENARRLSDVILSETTSKILLSCASYADLLLLHNSLYSLIQETELVTKSSTRAVLNQLIPYLVSTTKPIPLNLVPALDSRSLQQLASKYQFQPSFVDAVLKTSEISVLELTEYYIAKHDSSNSVLRFLMSPYAHISQLKDFQLNIRLLCSQIGNIQAGLLSQGQRKALFGYYKTYCHASNGVINHAAISRSQLSLCLFDSEDLMELTVDDLREMRDLISNDCNCLTDMQKFVLFSKIKTDLEEHEFFRDLLWCFETFLDVQLAEQIVRNRIKEKSFCEANLPDNILQSEKISTFYIFESYFDFSKCSDSQKIKLSRTLKFSDQGRLRPKNNAFKLDYLHSATKQISDRKWHQNLARELVENSQNIAVDQLEAFSLTGSTIVELPANFVSNSKFCSEAIFAVGMVEHKNVPSSILKSWVNAYFTCQPDKLVLATRKDVDLLGNLACYISPNWVRTMTAYTFKVYLSRISECTIDLQLGKVIKDMILQHKFVDSFTLSSIAPLYCFLDPELNHTASLLPLSFYSTAANSIYTHDPIRFFEFVPSERSALIGCADALSSEAANRDPSFTSLAKLTCTSRLDSQQFSCWNYLKFQNCE